MIEICLQTLSIPMFEPLQCTIEAPPMKRCRLVLSSGSGLDVELALANGMMSM